MRLVLLFFLIFALSFTYLIPHLQTTLVISDQIKMYVGLGLLVLAIAGQLEVMSWLRMKNAFENLKRKLKLEEKTQKIAAEDVVRLDIRLKEEQEAAVKLKKELELSLKSNQKLQADKSSLTLAFQEQSRKTEQLEEELENSGGDTEQGALTILSLLQEKGRFVDFVMGDIAQYTDEQIGSAARVVHSGCQQVIADCMTIKPLRGEEEGETITVNDTKELSQTRILGATADALPYKGRLIHRGWLASQLKLPENIDKQDKSLVIAQAEVESV